MRSEECFLVLFPGFPPGRTPETINKIYQRRELKETLINSKTKATEAFAQTEDKRCLREELRSIRRNKRRNMKELHNITRKLSGTHSHSNKTITEEGGQVLSTQEAHLDRLAEHFEEVLNRPVPAEQDPQGKDTTANQV